jgi:hypothetical protein
MRARCTRLRQSTVLRIDMICDATAKTHRRDARCAEVSINCSLRLLYLCGDMTFLQDTHVLYHVWRGNTGNGT